ncbi:hypothetical protein KM043_018212 [Ampulex compressa]|nr:hypothetical protein KM043_018212 [Ampulex compressa]
MAGAINARRERFRMDVSPYIGFPQGEGQRMRKVAEGPPTALGRALIGLTGLSPCNAELDVCCCGRLCSTHYGRAVGITEVGAKIIKPRVPSLSSFPIQEHRHNIPLHPPTNLAFAVNIVAFNVKTHVGAQLANFATG